MAGRIEAIFIAGEAKEPQRPVQRAHLVAGAGIVGDRYYDSQPREAGRNVTLIEAEEIERFNAEHRARAPLDGTRRNIVTRGVRLNDLVGAEFHIGGVRARGVELCEPCSTLEKLTRPGVLKGMVHRAGLNVDILSDGEIGVGDPVITS
jgi:MOSC domain-containing protein YiiM